MTNWILEYYQRIKDGTIIVGKWVKLLYEYIIKGIEEKQFYYDAKKANKAVSFVESFCHHSKGPLAPNHVKLELWQKAMLSCIFGIVDEEGVRFFREVHILVGRKVGKSLIASGIAEYMAYADGEYGADVYFIAPKLDQTDIVFNDFWQSVSAEPDLAQITKKRKTDIYIERTNTSIKKIAFSQKKSDGFNPHLTVCDEVAAWHGDAGIKQYEVMTSGVGSRKQPLTVSITTQNYETDGIEDDIIRRATAMLKGRSSEKRLLPFLYQIDDVGKWNDLNELQKSLPNLGVSVSYDFIIEEIAKAEQSLANKAEFMTKYACIKQNSSQAWLNTTDVEKCFGEPINIESLRHKYAVVGIDLSRTTDLTACSLLVETGGKINVITRFYLPANKIEEATARDGLPYQIYIEKGFLFPSGDNFVDYKDCFNWLASLVNDYEILPLCVGYDRYSANYLIQDLNTFGFKTDDVYQGENLTPVIREFEGMLKDGRFYFGDNDLMKAHLLDSAVKINSETERMKLVKVNKNGHIDGTAALLDACCVRQKWWKEIGNQLTNGG